MKTNQALSAILRQLRPSLRQTYPAYLHPRPISQLAPLRNPRTSHAPNPSTPKSLLSLRAPHIRRISGSTSASASAVARSQDYPRNTQSGPEKPPAYELTFTCKPCKHRSTHRVSKQAYHKGSVLITCPECSNRHIMSDHLKIFGDRSITIEDLMRQKGQLVKRGTLDGSGDLEFWDDGTLTERDKSRMSQ